MENPFTPKTQKALRVFGRLIRDWSKNVGIPKHTKVNAHTIVIERGDFLDALKAADLSMGATATGPADFEIRDGIQCVELILRRPDRFTLVLPEPAAVADVAEGDSKSVQVPAIYKNVEPDYAGTLSPESPATFTVTLDRGNYDKFLDPYMAGYCCTQCH